MLNQVLKEIRPKIEELDNHSLYSQINSLEKLRFFMERHVFAVFDFMSLVKTLQHEFSPIEKIWTPPAHRELSRFINEIVLAEESDELPGHQFMSHFEMYCKALAEIKGNSDLVQKFVQMAKEHDVFFSLDKLAIPHSSKSFIRHTFELINENKIHKVIGSFCFGREKIIPTMFLSLLEKINIKEEAAPTFYYYLKRHIEVDGESHGPLAMTMLSVACGNDQTKWEEATQASLSAINARITFWNEVSSELSASFS